MGRPVTARDNQIKHPSIPSLEFVPNTTPAALLIQMTVLDQVAEMLLQRISAHTRTAGKISYAASTLGLNGAPSTASYHDINPEYVACSGLPHDLGHAWKRSGRPRRN